MSVIDILLHCVENWLAKIVKINEYKQIKSDLRTAGMDTTLEQYTANAIIKASIVGILAVPALFVFPINSLVIIFLAVFLYNKEMKYEISEKLKVVG